MPLLGWIILFTAFGGVASAAFAGVFWLLPRGLAQRLVPHLVSFATGALLGAALLALLPEAIESVGPAGAHAIGASLAIGLGIFFAIEKLVLWRHAGHDHGHTGDREHATTHEEGAQRRRAAAVLVLVGDSVHNTLDGVLIAAAFLTSVPLGLVTSFAVAAHEIPHRLGDFVILVHAGLSRSRALVLNLATGLASILGGIAAFFALRGALGLLPYCLAVAAAGFLYIAVAGLIPDLHRRADLPGSLAQILLITLGVSLIAWADSLAHE
jgi:zinc and cadmium transporter